MTENGKSIQGKLIQFENEYKNNLLLGSIRFSTEEIDYLKRQVLAAYNTYVINETISKDRSLFVSLYAINYVRYFYKGDRFWEYLADYLKVDEDTMRQMTIEAMKRTYKVRKWHFYTSKRNEYVETIRMHGILGNDPSGDKIIYALYLVYLKDFDKHVTKEKLKLFFPYLEKVFRQVSDDINESLLRSHSGIAYVRGQLPKSFVRAHYVNKQKVNELIEMIFLYFSYLEDEKQLPKTFDSRLLYKLDQSFRDNDQYKNEYTLPFIVKQVTKSPDKKVVYYYNKTTQVNIPSHFIDFSPQEKKSAEVLFYEDNTNIKSFDLKVYSGGLGWKTQESHYKLKKKQSCFRYLIRKKESREIVYDSRKEHFQSEMTKNTVHVHLPEKTEKARLDHLKSGYLYSVNDTNSVTLHNGHGHINKGHVDFVMQDKTKVSVGDRIYSSKDEVSLLSVRNLKVWSNVKAVEDRKHSDIYKGSFLFELLLRYPYDLSNLKIVVNRKRFNGLDIRRLFLTDISVRKKGDLLYTVDFAELLSEDKKNQIEIFLVTPSAKGRITKLVFYYSLEDPVNIRAYLFNGKTYFTSEERSIKTVLTASGNSSWLIFNDPTKSYSLAVDKIDELAEKLNAEEFEALDLYDTEGQLVTEDRKEKILGEVYDECYLNLESYLLSLTDSIGVNAFLQQILHSNEIIKATLKSALDEIENTYIEEFVDALYNCLSTEKSQYLPFEERYIVPYLETFDLNQLDEESKHLVKRALKSSAPAVEDISLQLAFESKLEQDSEQSSLHKLFYQMSTHRQDIAIKLYTIASKLKMETRQTIDAIKEVSRFNTSRNSMEYYEIVLNFRDLLKEKKFELPNIYYPLFLDILVYLAIDYNLEIVVDYMNTIEEAMHHSREISEDNKHYIRKRLLEIYQVAGLSVEVVGETVYKEIV